MPKNWTHEQICSRSERCCYELATGALSFRGESSGVVFESILNRAPVPAVRLNPDLPSDLQRIIAKCLEKDRNLRYQHASEIRTDLQRLKRDTESSRAVAIPPLPDKTLKRGKLWIVLTACIAVIGLAVAGTLYMRSRRTVRIDSIAVLPFSNLSRCQYRVSQPRYHRVVDRKPCPCA